MSAYPFPGVSWNTFFDRLTKEFGVTITDRTDFTELSRGERFCAVAAGRDLDECVMPSVIRSACAALDVDPVEFGMHLPCPFEEEKPTD